MGNKRMTTEEIIKWVKDNSNCEIVGITNINGGRKAYIFKCGCGEEFIMQFANFKKGNKACKKCSDIMTRQSMSFGYEYVKTYIESKGCKLISKEYINCDTKIVIECGRCGEEFETTFDIFKNRNRIQCRSCSFDDSSKKQAHSYDYISNYIRENGCELISETYENNHEKLKIKCGCGNIFYNSFSEFKIKKVKQCPNCGAKLRGIDKKFSYDYIKKYIDDVGLELVDENYNNTTDYIYVKCECGDIFKTTFLKISHGKKHKCNKCTGWNFNIETVREFVENNSNCKLISTEYTNCDEKLLFECGCGNTFETTFDNFKGKKMKRSCNECTERSKLEKITMEFLKSVGIKYIKEKSFKGCVNPRTNVRLRYDYYLPTYNILIELDGVQHFEPTKFHKMSDEEANDRFEDQQIRDDTKNKYALNNGIKLIRIPYWDILNIENILIKELKLERMIEDEIRKTSWQTRNRF